MSKPLILVSNDDGIQADGLRALCEAVQPLGEIFVVAPNSERSAVGHAITLSTPLMIDPYDLNMPGITAYSCTGTPADCVKLGVLDLLPRRPDLVVSGFNHGRNTGMNVIYSGTVSVATEATILGINAIAFSINARRDFEFEPAKVIAGHIVRTVLEKKLPPRTLLNVNIPNQPAAEFPPGNLDGTHYDLTIHGRADWEDWVERREDPRNRVYYWLAGKMRDHVERGNTDDSILKKGRVSVTPIRHDLTDYQFIEDSDSWDIFQNADLNGKP